MLILTADTTTVEQKYLAHLIHVSYNKNATFNFGKSLYIKSLSCFVQNIVGISITTLKRSFV